LTERRKSPVPVYEYRCTECGDKSERMEGLGEDSSGQKCPSCEIGVIKKIFSPFGTGHSDRSESCSPPGKSRFR
jgi:putative FmdB family regulatory protein